MKKPLKKTDAAESTVHAGKVLAVLFCILIVWSLVIALGTLLANDRFDVRKPMIVLTTMGGFLGVWWLALRRQN